MRISSNASRVFGFDSVVTNFDEPDHPDGPALALIARRLQSHSALKIALDLMSWLRPFHCPPRPDTYRKAE